jgi:SAM-dependent methyltransferase
MYLSATTILSVTKFCTFLFFLDLYITVSNNMETIYEDGSYLANNESWHIEDSPWKAEQITKIVKSNQVTFKSAVEVGCGAGGVVYELAKIFPEVQFSGFEISPQAAQFWSRHQRDNLKIELQDFLTTSNHYDLLLLIDVFEHVPDYMGFLKSLSARSKYFVFNIPLDMHIVGLILDNQINARNKYGHLHYFSKATALQTLTDTGYKIVDYFYAPGFAGAPPESSRKTWQQRILHPFRTGIYSISPALSTKLLGGSSLMVLATAEVA